MKYVMLGFYQEKDQDLTTIISEEPNLEVGKASIDWMVSGNFNGSIYALAEPTGNRGEFRVTHVCDARRGFEQAVPNVGDLVRPARDRRTRRPRPSKRR